MSKFIIAELSYPLPGCVEQRVQTFLREAYGWRFSLKYPRRWQWLYFRLKAKGFVAWCDGNIVGHVGAMPFRATARNDSIEGAWSVDTYVLKNYRGEGLGKRLQERAQNTYAAFQSVWMSDINKSIKYKLGGITKCWLITMQWAINNVDIRESIFGDYVVHSPSPAIIADHAQRYLKSFDYYVVRSEPYCRWRFVDQPLSAYQQVSFQNGVVLMRKCGHFRPKTGMIGDVFTTATDPKLLAPQIRSAAFELGLQGCEFVRYATASFEIAEILLGCGWQVISCRPLILHTKSKLVNTAEKVFLSLSDQDMDQYPW